MCTIDRVNRSYSISVVDRIGSVNQLRVSRGGSDICEEGYRGLWKMAISMLVIGMTAMPEEFWRLEVVGLRDRESFQGFYFYVCIESPSPEF